MKLRNDTDTKGGVRRCRLDGDVVKRVSSRGHHLRMVLSICGSVCGVNASMKQVPPQYFSTLDGLADGVASGLSQRGIEAHNNRVLI